MTAGNNTTRPIRVADVAGPVSVAANEFALDRYPLNAPIDYSPRNSLLLSRRRADFRLKQGRRLTDGWVGLRRESQT